MDKLSKSYVCGVAAQPLRYQTVGEALDETAQRFGEREALVVRHQGLRLSWAGLRQRADALAAGLLRLGLERGERVGIWAPNCAEWVLTQLATARAGLVLVTINPAYRVSELEFALRKVGCRALVTARRFRSSDYLGMLRDLAPELAGCAPGALRSERLPALRHVLLLDDPEAVPGSGPEAEPGSGPEAGPGSDSEAGTLRLDEVAGSARPEDHEALARLQGELQPDDPINIQFTSGTTGLPKGATLSHFNILNNGHFVGEALRLGPEDRVCIPVPLYHCFGMVLGNLACLSHGAAMVQPGPVFDPLAVLEAVEAERCTALYGVPTMFIAELGHARFRDFDLSSLRTGIMAGAPCPVEVMKRVVADMHMGEVTIAYGMTETSPVSFQSGPDDPLEKRVSTVGRVHPHVEVKIVDDAGRVVPPGERGELLTRGYCVMLGYWDDPERTAEAVDAAGWMHTGDLATLDEDGTARIVGRKKDMVIRGGENLYPREIEEFLYRHPDVEDVQVFGVPDPRYGEELCAWVVARPGARLAPEALRDFCRGQIAHHKIPRYVKLVEAFPMTVTGKAQKFRMREQMCEELGLAPDS